MGHRHTYLLGTQVCIVHALQPTILVMSITALHLETRTLPLTGADMSGIVTSLRCRVPCSICRKIKNTTYLHTSLVNCAAKHIYTLAASGFYLSQPSGSAPERRGKKLPTGVERKKKPSPFPLHPFIYLCT
ncbi:uncharacterized protein F4807DRAFT_447997 [Annulohypoxylon truncatum]|uniref:uncharacterized protein n=1 Tax=Annulohypoxylon truncatum TaxID=327061 RepID=UPI002007D3D4|nr:uncharacterized protein F4807DRAFT_447997 [Annulohypoxylon truncatum]KAI1204294.1 hypothetical protein F4807DRAFT_447997 [Annulohypoxylon truncatum]